MKIVGLHKEDGTVIARAKMAASFKDRYIGLMREQAMDPGQSLLLVPGRSIHTFGMRFAIDVVFLDRQLRVLGWLNHVAPWRFAFAPGGTRLVLALPDGRIAQVGLALHACVCVCFDDEEGEEIAPGIRRRSADSIVRPRPPSPCLSFSLRLPEHDHASGNGHGRHHLPRSASGAASSCADQRRT